jgi:hypothetical protein
MTQFFQKIFQNRRSHLATALIAVDLGTGYEEGMDLP